MGRPVLVVQSGEIDADAYDSVVVCLITGSSTRGGVCRVEIAASSTTGLERPSEIMVEKIAAIPDAGWVQRSGRRMPGRCGRWIERCCCYSIWREG